MFSRITWLGILLLLAPGITTAQEEFPEEAAQERYLDAMAHYDAGEYDEALAELEDARKEARQLPRSWRKNVLKVVEGAIVGVLYEAGLSSFESESFQSAYQYFDRCLDKMGKKTPAESRDAEFDQVRVHVDHSTLAEPSISEGARDRSCCSNLREKILR